MTSPFFAHQRRTPEEAYRIFFEALQHYSLRELVRKMWRDLHAHGYEATTVLNARYSDSIRELGIEVDL